METGEVEGIIEAAEEVVPETIEAAAKVVAAAKAVAAARIVVKTGTGGPPEVPSIAQFRIPLPTSCAIVITSMPTKLGIV